MEEERGKGTVSPSREALRAGEMLDIPTSQK